MNEIKYFVSTIHRVNGTYTKGVAKIGRAHV